MNYTSIKKENDALKRILYMFVGKDEDLDKAYKGDKFIEEVLKNAREISGEYKIPLFLSEVRRLDREEAVQEGYNIGKLEKQTEMIINLYNSGALLDLISKSSGLSIDGVKRIIESNK